MEPGGGKFALGRLPDGTKIDAHSVVMEKPASEADRFAQRFMVAKCVAMVRAFRSHPSLIRYVLQNEAGADLNNPDTVAVLDAMRAEDPSRIVLLNDGMTAPPISAAQAWYAPYDARLHRSDREPFGGWWDDHQGAGDQWYDAFYADPGEFQLPPPDRAADRRARRDGGLRGAGQPGFGHCTDRSARRRELRSGRSTRDARRLPEIPGPLGIPHRIPYRRKSFFRARPQMLRQLAAIYGERAHLRRGRHRRDQRLGIDGDRQPFRHCRQSAQFQGRSIVSQRRPVAASPRRQAAEPHRRVRPARNLRSLSAERYGHIRWWNARLRDDRSGWTNHQARGLSDAAFPAGTVQQAR